MTTKLIQYIKNQKNNTIVKTKLSFIDIFNEFKKNNKDFIIFSVKENIDIVIKCYAHKSQNFVIKFVNLLHSKLYYEGLKLTIHAKRENENMILIKLYELNTLIIIYNIVYDFDKLLINSKTLLNKKMIKIHYLLHKLLYYESYFNHKSEEYTINIKEFRKILKPKKVKHITMNKKNLYVVNPFIKFLYEIIEIKYIIFIGGLILNKIYNINNFGNILDMIYLGNISSLYEKLSIKKTNLYDKVEFVKSDFEMMNNYIKLYKDNHIKYRIFNGYRYCFPYISINNLKIGTKLLIGKYLLLDLIINNMFTDKKIIYFLQNIDYNRELFNNCYGKSVTPYYTYRYKKFLNEGKPWNWTKTIYLNKDSNYKKLGGGSPMKYYCSNNPDEVVVNNENIFDDKELALILFPINFENNDINIITYKFGHIYISENQKGKFNKYYHKKSTYLYYVKDDKIHKKKYILDIWKELNRYKYNNIIFKPF
jgi:hypothetical protein